MKPRKVIIQLEVLTDANVKDLEKKSLWDFDVWGDTNPMMVQFDITEKPKVNVVKK